ncbi:MAG: M42 family peptidase, partial [Enterocloster bolteae]
EEVGTRGATVTAQQVQPDLAIVFEGSPADDFYFRAGIAQGCLRSGVQIRHMDNSYISNVEFIRFAQETGDKLGIKYQDAVRRGGSTNAGKISLTGKAVPVLVLGIPSRYVHSHYNFCAEEDVDATVRMAVEVIRGLDEERIARILRKEVI